MKIRCVWEHNGNDSILYEMFFSRKKKSLYPERNTKN